MHTERLSPAQRARLTDAAKERAHALRRAAVHDALDALSTGLAAWAARAAAASHTPRPTRHLEA